MSYIRLNHIKKSFSKVEVIKEVNIQIDKGDFICFVGPSGCGKSTLLRMIAGLERQDSGEIWIDEQNVSDKPPAKRGVAMVFQTYALYPHLNVYNNMALALKQAKVPKSEIEKRISDASQMLKLGELLKRFPSELSGGQRQRVAIGRSMVRHPKVFLLDEPLSNLDAALRVEVRVNIARLHTDLDTTMIYVTHDQVEAMTLANKVVILNKGKIEQIGSPMEVYFKPANIFVAGFIGTPKMNLIHCNYSEGKIKIGSQFQIEAQLPLNNDEKIILGVRPQFWKISDSGMPVKVLICEKLGSETFVYGETERQEMVTVKIDGSESYQVGTLLKISPEIGNSLFFNSIGNRIELK